MAVFVDDLIGQVGRNSTLPTSGEIPASTALGVRMCPSKAKVGKRSEDAQTGM